MPGLPVQLPSSLFELHSYRKSTVCVQTIHWLMTLTHLLNPRVSWRRAEGDEKMRFCCEWRWVGEYGWSGLWTSSAEAKGHEGKCLSKREKACCSYQKERQSKLNPLFVSVPQRPRCQMARRALLKSRTSLTEDSKGLQHCCGQQD